ncbi:PTAC beta [Nannizzia gypsea CBS 118893]|uniref:SAGA-associated factor 11 n=1 Tax=Arthroderma gypseum (strain ATCC MYA-4604 / CBS 118893) TaxID=535722 RepID=E5R0J2_ARTGP|nr:PTAC beta [Nannizzia gypsea CBS 118893]EFQ98336.1 PTAC beta [Nannizzia gypsea CBS 118893]
MTSADGAQIMAGPEKNKEAAESDHMSPTDLARLTRQILDDTFYNIIHDIVAKVHKEEKVARQQSAVVTARQLAEESTKVKDSGEEANGTADAGSSASHDHVVKSRGVRLETESAIFDSGKVYLKGNPLEKVKEIICPNCRLPRLLYPAYGEGSRPVDASREYCRKQPPVNLHGRDVHGHHFAVEKITKKKKTQPAASTPGSSPPSIPDTPGPNPLLQPKPDKIYVPTTKCPNCPRYFLLTKSAQHLDRCLGISTRQSRIRTPLANSESGTPGPSQPANARKRVREGEEEGAPGPVKKKKDFGLATKLKSQKPAAPSKLKNGTTADMISVESSKPSTSGKAGKQKA